jgi:hypothetical protein
MMTKRARLSAVLLWVFLLGFTGNLAGQFGPQPFYVGIPTAAFNFAAASQTQNEWCWAASTQMILNWYNVPVTQPEIVQRVFGAVVDQPATDAVISAALNGWGYTRNGQTVIIRSVGYPGAPPPMTLINELSQQHPILLTFLSGPYSGHAVVITGASYINTQWGPQIISLVIRDPFPTPQTTMTQGRIEIAGPSLGQFANAMRGYWLVSVAAVPPPAARP